MLILLCVITSAASAGASAGRCDSTSVRHPDRNPWGKNASCICKGDALCRGPTGLCWRASCERETRACPASGAHHGYKPSTCRGRCSCQRPAAAGNRQATGQEPWPVAAAISDFEGERCRVNGQVHMMRMNRGDARDGGAGTAPGPRYLCVPQKCGNKNWGGLAFFMLRGRPPRNSTESRASEADFEVPIGQWQPSLRSKGVVAAASEHVLMMARNPYARVLAHYLNFHADGCVDPGGQSCWRGQPPTRERFEGWVLATLARPGGGGNGGGRAASGSARRSPIKAHEACATNRNLCPQVNGCGLRCFGRPPTVLKLEEQPRWWPRLLETLQVGPADLEGEAWRGFSGQPAFYRAPRDAAASTLGNVHATNATARIHEFYSPAAAEIVTAVYRDDIVSLGYPVLDPGT